MSDAVVNPCSGVQGELRVPGDKSISHRAAMLSALATGTSTIRNYLTAEDCLNTLAAVVALGARVDVAPDMVLVEGTGGRFSAPAGVLDMGNSGTGMRLLAGLLAGHNFQSELSGDASLLTRPMGRIQAPLQRMGAEVQLLGPRGCGPIRVSGGDLVGVTYELPVASAQVKGCVLFAGLFAKGETTVVEPRKTRDHTERAFRFLGIPVGCAEGRISLERGRGADLDIPAREWLVPGDFSSAAFWLTAACRPGSAVTVRGVGLNPRRTAFLDVLVRMGADITIEPDADDNWEPTGTICVRGRRLSGTVVCGDEIPNLIDEVPLIAVAGALADGETIIRDAEELRVKESDRIATTAASLGAMGVNIEETPDGMRIQGGEQVRGGVTVDSVGDHRIAMASAILALSADAPVTIHNVDCIATSYPTFWQDLESICMRQ